MRPWYYHPMYKPLLAILLTLTTLPALASGGMISAAEWAQPRSGEWVLQQPVIAEVVRALQQQPGARLQLSHPGGDEGTLWAEEVQAWLIALGVPSSRIERVPGSGSADTIQLQLQH